MWETIDEIDWEILPNQFVLKCTHDSGGGVIICRDKSKLDIEETKIKLNNMLSNNYYYAGREWPYKNVKPRIIAEKYIVDDSSNELKDYKFFCFNGEPKLMFIASNRETKTKFDFFDMDFNKIKLKNGYDNSSVEIKKPDNFKKMKELSSILAEDYPHVRIDFYNINGHIYFGEFTFFHHNGMVKFEPEEYDNILGDWLTLPKITK